MNTPILVVGESVVDLVAHADPAKGETSGHPAQAAPTTHTGGPAAPTAHAGGSPANVARGLVRLGLPTTFLTQLGTDSAGTTMRAALDGDRVRTVVDPIPHTPTALALLDATGAATYTFKIAWTLASAYTAFTPATQHVHAGSIGTFMEPGAATSVAIAQRAHEAGATVSFDPNMRPDLITDVAPVRARVEQMAASADVIKASDEDLAFLYPHSEPRDIAEKWLAGGTALVIITRGGAGSLLLTASHPVDIPPIRTRVVDTVGAGDSYMAAVIAWLGGARAGAASIANDVEAPAQRGLRSDAAAHVGAEGDREGASCLLGNQRALRVLSAEDLAAMGAFASRVAGITVSRAGANPPRLAELA